MTWIKWWKNKDAVVLLLMVLAVMGIVFVTVYYFNNPLGLVAGAVELVAGGIMIRKQAWKILDAIAEWLERRNDDNEHGC